MRGYITRELVETGVWTDEMVDVSFVTIGSGISAFVTYDTLRIIDDRDNLRLNTRILQLFRHYVAASRIPNTFSRCKGGPGWSHQGFDYPKSVWGGRLKAKMRTLQGEQRAQGYRNAYRVTLSALVATVLLGVLWELLYHFLQQFRWEKDWPTMFAFWTVINEAALMWVLVHHTTLVLPRALLPSPTVFLIQFGVTWIVFWLIGNGPMRVVFHRWRFQAGRFL